MFPVVKGQQLTQIIIVSSMRGWPLIMANSLALVLDKVMFATYRNYHCKTNLTEQTSSPVHSQTIGDSIMKSYHF